MTLAVETDPFGDVSHSWVGMDRRSWGRSKKVVGGCCALRLRAIDHPPMGNIKAIEYLFSLGLLGRSAK